MKIPKTFIPDKNLDTKTEKLKELVYLDDVNLEDLKRILYGKPESMTFSEREEILEHAVSKIVKDTLKKKIKWQADSNVYGYKAKATVLNYQENHITIPVVFEMSEDMGFLYLGNRRGPCKNTFHEKVKQLAVEYFKMDSDKLLPIRYKK